MDRAVPARKGSRASLGWEAREVMQLLTRARRVDEPETGARRVLDAPSPGPKHLLTVSVEDYFHVGAFAGALQRKHWRRLRPRLDRTIAEVLELFAQFDARATFFVLGCVADRNPTLIRRIAEAGHEIASSGYWPHNLDEIGEDELREDLQRSREALESAGANRVVGYRAARHWLRERHLWVLDVLASEGFLYDSSVNPALPRIKGVRGTGPFRVHQRDTDNGPITEIPISTVGLGPLRLAISGGNYIRQLPHSLLRWWTKRWDAKRKDPLVFYFMPWELDPEQPHLRSVSWLNRLRHYRNLAKTRWVMEFYLRRLRFQTVGDHLNIDYDELQPEHPQPQAQVIPIRPYREQRAKPRPATAVSIVVPLYNEEENVDYLHRTLSRLRQRLWHSLDLRLVLVDDGSKDKTWELMEQVFGDEPETQLVKQPENRGVAAAILRGIQAAETEIVCSIDCDCSYDPNEIAKMVPLLEDADLVTASPYHPSGSVFNVPNWRLFLSRTLSRLYNRLLRDELHTYTSCFRLYRRSWFAEMDLEHANFLGVAEMLLKAKLQGARIVEYPTTLECRIFGESKMKTLSTIVGHLGLLRRLVVKRSDWSEQTPRSQEPAR